MPVCFFDRLFLTTGFYYFNNEHIYHEYRSLAFGSIQQSGGGTLDVETFGLFMSGDYDLTDWLTLTLGLRYTHEEKDAAITNLTRNGATPCNIVTGPDCPVHFRDKETWTNLSPKIRAELSARCGHPGLCPLDARLSLRRL